MNRYLVGLVVVLAALFAASIDNATAVTIATVPIGNPGNAADSTGFGDVGYSFRMGRTEVTNSQYVEFLNAVAMRDNYFLYDARPASNNSQNGIVRTGLQGSYIYAVKAPAVGQGPGGSDYVYDDKPVTYVSWTDAIRFANWLHNGQGAGDTESGAYTILGGAFPANLSSITRNAGAKWFLPSQDEWYKSAFYDPRTGAYRAYATDSDVKPDNHLPFDDSGNSANFTAMIGTTGNVDLPFTDAGAYQLSPSPYGTFDQAGNVAEWNEAGLGSAFSRPIRGGSALDSSPALEASWLTTSAPPNDFPWLGFRVAAVPEPSTGALALVAALAVCVGRQNNPPAFTRRVNSGGFEKS